MVKPTADKPKASLLTLDHIVVRGNDRAAFACTCWTWRRGEQWAILGPNGSGKSLFALALCGRVPLLRGEIRYHFPATAMDAVPEQSIALLSPEVQREFATSESSFYQSRWHSGIAEGRQTVAQFLSQASVEDINPFEVGARKSDSRRFRENRRRFHQWLGIEPLSRRKLISLSNGEQRKVLLVHTLLRSPRLLILDDPFGGLDVATRVRLKTVIHRLMRVDWPVLLITSRPDELPPCTTHLLLMRNRRIIAQGSKQAILKHPLVRKLGGKLATLAGTPHRGVRTARRAILASPKARRTTPLIEFNHVTVRLGRQRILDDVTWVMRQGEHWALLGPNGSGKTTWLSLIQGDNPQAYALDLRLFGRRPQSTQTLWRVRRQIGWLSPELHLHYPPDWSCLDVVCSGFFNTIGLYETCTFRQRAAARDWLHRFGLGDRVKISFGELCLGDQRLVLLARAVIKRPKLLVLDEPCQGLDAAHRHSILATVDQVIGQTHAGLIFVTHHARELPGSITHILKLKSGRIHQSHRRR